MPDAQRTPAHDARASEISIEKRLATVRQNLRIAVAIRDTNVMQASLDAGLSRNSLGSFIKGKTSIGYANLLRVCDVLGVPISVLDRPGGVSAGRLDLSDALADADDLTLSDAAKLVERQRSELG